MEESRSKRIKRFSEIHSTVRVNTGKSQEYMALELGVAKKTIQNWEKGISSPSFFQSLEWFRVLKVNPFPYYLSVIYPEKLDGIKASDSDEKIEEAFETLIHNISIKDKRALLYLYYGKHGSSAHSVIQLMLAHLHTPITSRVANAYLISHVYALENELNNIICPDNILPDMDDLNKAILKARESAIKREYGYNNLEKEDAD